MKHHLFSLSRWRVNYEEALCSALRQGSAKSTEFLLEAGANLQEARASGSCDPLASAASSGNGELFFRILHSGITLPANGTALLESAIAGGNASIVEGILMGYMNRRERFQFDGLARAAAKSGNVEIMKLLKQYNISINVSCGDDIFSAPIAIAMMNHRTDMVNYLLKEVPHVATTTDDSGRTLLHVAAQGLNEYVVPLVDSGVSISQANDLGLRPVHVACRDGGKETLQALIAAMNPDEIQENLNARTSGVGCTPLHFAVMAESLDTVNVLLENGADPSIINYDAKLPIDIAKMKNYREILKTLEDYATSSNNSAK